MKTMYDIDLAGISIAKFKKLIDRRQVHKSRVLLYNGLDDKLQMLEQLDINSLLDLIKALSTPAKINRVAESTGIAVDYLVLLNREAKSYKTKVTLFEKIPNITDELVRKLKKVKLHNSKLFFEMVINVGIEDIAKQTDLPINKIVELFYLSDLVRIWGVGPVFARIVLECGVCSVYQMQSIDMKVYYHEFLRVNSEKGYTKAVFSLNDVLYCQQMAQGLQIVEINFE